MSTTTDNPKGYEVLVDEVTVHKAVRPINHPITGESMGFQQGNGATWYLGEVLTRDDMNPDWADALDKAEGSLFVSLSKRLKPVFEEPALNEEYRLGLPFAGYEDMDEDSILSIMHVMPSATVMRIKEWEARQDDPRSEIVNYNIGFGESPQDRQSGKINSGGEFAEEEDLIDKPSRHIATRQVPDSGPVIPGEGITGTGDPVVAPGTAAARAEEEDDSDDGSSRQPRQAASKQRAGRRPRAKDTSNGPTRAKKPVQDDD